MGELGQQTVDFSSLVTRAAEDSFMSLKDLVDKCKSSEQSDTDKKIMLLKYINQTQQRMLRLNVLAKWCKQVPLIQYCQQLGSTLSSHDTCFTQAADSLFFTHEGLQQARAPIYDVPSAIEVLLTGTYKRLPKCVGDIGNQGLLTEKEQKPALEKLDMLVRSKLLEVVIPTEITEIKIDDGTATLCVDGEFKVLVTLGYRGHVSLWRILHLELLVGEKSGSIKMEESQRYSLGDYLERKMAVADHPFVTLFSVLHDLCVSLVMDTVIRQVQALRQGRWKDAIRFELISDNSVGHGGTAASTQSNQDGEADSSTLRTPGIKIVYWLDFGKTLSSSNSWLGPSLKIEPGEDAQISCVNSTFVIDPKTGTEAKFSLDQSCIDVEKLLLRAISCNRYIRLLEIQRGLEKNIQIYQATGDVILQSHMDKPEDANKNEGTSEKEPDVLRVRAYGLSYYTLGINIRSGRFLLQAPKSIISPLVLLEEALNQGSMAAAEVFTNLRSKSILHHFASIGRFLGLEVYENGFTALEIPKNIMNGSPILLLGFPDCGNSYYLLLQLDKDFKPLFRLLKTQPGSSRTPSTDSKHMTKMKLIDIGQMQMLEDEQNISLLYQSKLLSLGPNTGPPMRTSEVGLSKITLENSMQIVGCPPSSFSSVVDEVFELEKGSLPAQNLSSTYNTSSPASQFGHLSTNIHGLKGRTSSPKWEGGVQLSQVNNAAKLTSVEGHYNISLHSSSNPRGPIQSSSYNSSIPGWSASMKKLSGSKSDQDLPSLKSPHSAEVTSSASMDEDHKDAVPGNRVSRLLSPPHPGGLRASIPSAKPNGPKSSPGVPQAGSLRVSGSSPLAAASVSQAANSATCRSSDHDAILKNDKQPRKRTISDVINMIPSLQGLEANTRFYKRGKVTVSDNSLQASSQAHVSAEIVPKIDGYSYGSLISEANKGNVPSSAYVSTLLYVVRHCSLFIKHARLTSQMEALNIPYVEEVNDMKASLNIWFRLPFARGDLWEHICLRLGRPGSMHWDVKITDQHFRDLWELQKGSNNTPWGSGVRIANASDVDSHIRYDPEGVVLSYQSVESDSIKKLVADISRVSNARTFALGMRKLLGMRTDERVEESSDVKVPVGAKAYLEAADRISEQLKKSFRIEAVGLMSLWFSYNVCGAGGTTVVARFVVEWDSGQEGCTMHVSPDQLWPHTKFLEDFINGAEVQSLLDCIRLTAGPLHALAAATRPARASPIPGVPGVPVAVSSVPKQSGYLPSQGVLSNSSVANAATSAPASNSVLPAGGPLSSHSLHGAAMLAAGGRGGPGIVPSSLLPIDVSVVLRGPYWIRIIYRKHFAVDMRCFAGDQVWLQPATPPKGGPSVGGSLPCPQFRPFIMEHVAQELNGSYDSTFAGGQQTVGLANTSNAVSVPQLPASNGNRVNLPSAAAIARAGNQMSGLNRMGNALPGSSNLSLVNAGLPMRRPPSTNVPPHLRGELNTAIIGLGDDGGYGGGWVPVVALKKVLRGILKYLGVLWLFAQLPDILKEILGSILKDNEGALLNLDQEQPALRFFVGGYVFAVSVHRVQLLLQVLSVKRFHHQQQQQQQQQNVTTTQEELTQAEISEICDYFSRRVASEPYDASRVASFITLLTLPISVLREFLKLIAWKKGLVQAQGGDIAPAQKPRIELCLEYHAGVGVVDKPEIASASKSSIHYDRPHNSVDFSLTVVLDPAHIPHINAAGGAAWLPYCVSVRLRYSFGESHNISFLGMEGSHGGRACWLRVDDWEKCKQRVARTVEVNGCSAGDLTQGRLKIVADSVQRTLHVCLQALRDGSGTNISSTPV